MLKYYGMFDYPGFSEIQFTETLTASGLIRAIIDSGIFMPNGKNDIDRLNNLLHTKGLYKKFPNLPLPAEATDLINREAQLEEIELVKLNQIVLEAAYPQYIPSDLKHLDMLSKSFVSLIGLFELFESGYLKPKSIELKEDIEEAIKAILEIEGFELKRKPYYGKKQEHRGFSQKNINTLNFLLKKCRIRVGVDFESNHILANSADLKPTNHKISSGLLKYIQRAGLKNKLSNLRFCLEDRWCSFRYDEDIRKVLTYGLFYYTDQLIHGKFLKPRKCVCNRWFLAMKRKHLYCSTKCKDKYYGQTKEGKEVRRRASKMYRLKKKKNISSHP